MFLYSSCCSWITYNTCLYLVFVIAEDLTILVSNSVIVIYFCTGLQTVEPLYGKDNRIFLSPTQFSYLWINIAMINPCPKNNFRWLEWIVCWKSDFQKEYAALVCSSRRSKDRSNPVVDIVAFRSSTEKND